MSHKLFHELPAFDRGHWELARTVLPEDVVLVSLVCDFELCCGCLWLDTTATELQRLHMMTCPYCGHHKLEQLRGGSYRRATAHTWPIFRVERHIGGWAMLVQDVHTDAEICL